MKVVMTDRVKNIFWSIASAMLVLPSYVARAQIIPPPGSGGSSGGGTMLQNPLGRTSTFEQLVENIANIVFKLGFVVAAIFIIYSGFKFVTAQGREDELKKAKDNFKWVIIGTAVLLGAKIIATAVRNTIEGLGT